MWTDQDIPLGESWRRLVESKIETCSALIVVMSPHARASEWVSSEIQLAKDLKKLAPHRKLQVVAALLDDLRDEER